MIECVYVVEVTRKDRPFHYIFRDRTDARLALEALKDKTDEEVYDRVVPFAMFDDLSGFVELYKRETGTRL